jgi:uncharacterized protein (DUF983 family)
MAHQISTYFHNALTLFWRATLLRCPRCGKAPLFRSGYTTYRRCPVCQWRFEREEGYWTGAMAVNLVVAELLIAAVVIPLAWSGAPTIPLLILSLPLPILIPVLFYWHAKAYWIAIDFLIHPVPLL